MKQSTDPLNRQNVKSDVIQIKADIEALQKNTVPRVKGAAEGSIAILNSDGSIEPFYNGRGELVARSIEEWDYFFLGHAPLDDDRYRNHIGMLTYESTGAAIGLFHVGNAGLHYDYNWFGFAAQEDNERASLMQNMAGVWRNDLFFDETNDPTITNETRIHSEVISRKEISLGHYYIEEYYPVADAIGINKTIQAREYEIQWDAYGEVSSFHDNEKWANGEWKSETGYHESNANFYHYTYWMNGNNKDNIYNDTDNESFSIETSTPYGNTIFQTGGDAYSGYASLYVSGYEFLSSSWNSEYGSGSLELMLPNWDTAFYASKNSMNLNYPTGDNLINADSNGFYIMTPGYCDEVIRVDKNDGLSFCNTIESNEITHLYAKSSDNGTLREISIADLAALIQSVA